jgi:hypothetical protein
MNVKPREVRRLKINSVLYEELKKNNNMITAARVVELGFSRTLLGNYVKAGAELILFQVRFMMICIH